METRYLIVHELEENCEILERVLIREYKRYLKV